MLVLLKEYILLPYCFFFPGVVLVIYFLLKPETIHVLIFQETHTHSRPIFMVSFNFNFFIFIF